MTSGVDVLLFDLGGVLVDFPGVERLSALLPDRIPDEMVAARWHACPHSLAFGTGSLTPETFAEGFTRDWAIDLDPHQFLAEYRSWARDLLPGARDLLAQLRPRYRLGALSNSNAVHWARLTHDLSALSLFEVALSSHEVGHRKPAREMYEAALRRFAVPPDAVLFFDDAQQNVEAARQVGMQARRVDGVAGVREALAEAGLL